MVSIIRVLEFASTVVAANALRAGGLLIAGTFSFFPATSVVKAADVSSNCVIDPVWKVEGEVSDQDRDGDTKLRVEIDQVGTVIVETKLLSLSDSEQDDTIREIANLASGHANGCTLTLEGEIGKGDARAVQDASEKLERIELNSKRIYLDSNGGLVDEALSIGRFLRANGYTAVVDSGEVCDSACVFVYAGAIQRVFHTRGHVRIHRPSLADDLLATLSAEQAEEVYREHFAAIASYLDEMRIDRRLYEEMQRIPINRSRELGINEMIEMRLVGWDPVAYDRERASITTSYGPLGRDLIDAFADQNEFIMSCVAHKTQAQQAPPDWTAQDMEAFSISTYWPSCADDARKAGFNGRIDDLINTISADYGLDWSEGWALRFRVRDMVDSLR